MAAISYAKYATINNCVLKRDNQINIEFDTVCDKTGVSLQEKVEEEVRKLIPEILEEGFQKIDSKTYDSLPLVYDLEKRIKEINGEIEISMRQLEKLADWAGGLEIAEQVLDRMYPSGYRLVIYEEEKSDRAKTGDLKMQEGTLYVRADDGSWMPIGQGQFELS